MWPEPEAPEGCKGANRPVACAKVQKWETTLRVAGGGHRWRVAGRETELKGCSMGGPDNWLVTYDRSINPGFRFPFERLPPATCHPGLPPAT